MVDGARRFSPVSDWVHSSTCAGPHCHGYSLVNARNRRTSRSRGTIVHSRSPRAICWARQPLSIASIMTSSGWS